MIIVRASIYLSDFSTLIIVLAALMIAVFLLLLQFRILVKVKAKAILLTIKWILVSAHDYAIRI